MTVNSSNNLTLSILEKAEQGKYAISAQSCYDAQSVLALIQAAESSKSPAILQLFPITMRQFGKYWVEFVIKVAHASTVPISVHVDHAAEKEDIEMILDWAKESKDYKVDSIMIDCSHAETDEENIEIAKPFVQRAIGLGMAVEVELGRLSGGEAGVRVIDEGMLTKPEKARLFLSTLGAHLLAPSVGNIHGRYSAPPNFNLELLETLHREITPAVPIALHGTDDLEDSLFRACIERGARKININSWARDPQIEYWSKHLPTDPIVDVYEGGMKEFAKVCVRFFKLLGSEGQA